MRLQSVILWLALSVAAPVPAAAGSPTPTEAAAAAAARNDHTAYTLPPKKLAKAVAVSQFYDTLYFVRAGWGITSLLLILQLGIAARMQVAALNLSANRWAQGFAFTLQFLLLYTLVKLPLSALGHWKSVKESFSVQGWASWFGDLGKSFLLEYVLGGLFVMLLFYLVRRSPRRWWLWLWFPTMAFVLFGTYLSPLLIDPLFNRFEPLSQAHPALVEQIERVAKHGGIDIPPDRMFLMKASAKTTTLNAYVTGFGSSKRLVVWDTLLGKATPDEIALIAGHEMGHYVLGHVLRGVFFSFGGILLAFFVGFHLFQFALRRFGRRWGVGTQGDWAALAVMVLVLSVISFLAEPIGNAISRSMEQDADIFGLEAVHGIVADPQATGQADFQMLGEDELVDPNPSALVEFWTDSHPSISFRAAFAKHYDPWAPGAEPKFFKK